MVGRFEILSQLIVIITNMNGTCKKPFPNPNPLSILHTKITLIKYKNHLIYIWKIQTYTKLACLSYREWIKTD